MVLERKKKKPIILNINHKNALNTKVLIVWDALLKYSIKTWLILALPSNPVLSIDLMLSLTIFSVDKPNNEYCFWKLFRTGFLVTKLFNVSSKDWFRKELGLKFTQVLTPTWTILLKLQPLIVLLSIFIKPKKMIAINKMAIEKNWWLKPLRNIVFQSNLK